MGMSVEDLQNLQRNIDLFQSLVKEIFTNAVLEAVVGGDLTSEQMKCLRFICCNEKLLVGQLAKGLRISYPAATKAISRLEEKGIVFRQKDPLDKRNIFVSLTQKGVELAENIKDEKLKKLEQLLSSMTGEEVNAFKIGITAPIRAVLTDKKLSQAVCLHCGKEHQEDCLISNADCFCFL